MAGPQTAREINLQINGSL